MTWATSTGTTVVGSLVPTAAEYDSTIVESGVTYGLIKYSFSGSPNLSGVLAGHRLTVAGFTNAENNGTYRVYDANDTTDEIRVYNTSRLSNSLDETGITGTGSVADAGAVITEPSTAKKAQGFLTPEKPSDGMWNWILNDMYTTLASVNGRGVHINAGPSNITSSTFANLDGLGLRYGEEWTSSDGAYTASANDGAYESVADVNLDITNGGTNKILHIITGQVNGSNGPFNPQLVVDGDTSPVQHIIETSASNYADGVTQAKAPFSYATITGAEAAGAHDLDIQAVRFTSNAATQLRALAIELYPTDDSGNNLVRAFSGGITESTMSGTFTDISGYSHTATFQNGNKCLVLFGSGVRSTSSVTSTSVGFRLLVDAVDTANWSVSGVSPFPISSFTFNGTMHELSRVIDVTGAHTIKMQALTSGVNTHYAAAGNGGYFGLVELPTTYNGDTLMRYTDDLDGDTVTGTTLADITNSGSQTTNGHGVLLMLSGRLTTSATDREVTFQFQVDGADVGSEYTQSFPASASNSHRHFSLMIFADGIAAGSHTFSCQAKVAGGSVTITLNEVQFAAFEMPTAAVESGSAPSVTLSDTTGKKVVVEYAGTLTGEGGTVSLRATEDGSEVGQVFELETQNGVETPFSFRAVADAPASAGDYVYRLQGKSTSGACLISGGELVVRELSANG